MKEETIVRRRKSLKALWQACCGVVMWRGRLAGSCALVVLLVAIAVGLSGCAPSLSPNVASAGIPPARSTSAATDYNQAESFRLSGHCTQAIPLYLRALSKNDLYVHAYDGLGSCYGSSGDFKPAILEYDKAIQIDPTNYGLYINRAGVEANNGSTGQATDDLKQALQLAPPQVLSYSSIADDFVNFVADFSDAIAALNKAISLVPGDPNLYEHRANIYYQAHDYSRAFADYQTALKVAPYTGLRARVYADEAGVYDSFGDINSAYGAMSAAIKLQPDNAHFYVQSGNIHRDGNASTRTILMLYDHALQLSSTGSDALAAYEAEGDVYASIGRTKAAVDKYGQALKLLGRHEQFNRPRIEGKIKALVSGQS